MFKIIILLVFLAFMYVVLKSEKRIVRFSMLAYFTLLSIVFMAGIFNISSTYHLSDDPIEGGFAKLFGWVSSIAYLYLIPLFLFTGYKLMKWTNENMNKTWKKVMMSVFMLAVLLAVGYVSLFIFVLLFYGFAP